MNRKGPMQGQPTEAQVLAAIVAYKRENGISPSLDDLALALDVTKNLIWRRLVNLHNDRRVTWIVNQPRTIEVVGGKWIYTEDV